MSTHKYIDRLCALALALTLAVTALFMGGEALGLQPAAGGLGYEERLFDAGRVHTLDIIMDGWEDFLSGCEDKEYTACTLVIDGEACRNVAIRAKGNSSLSTVSSYGNNRYSFKVEFDHYDDANTYYGLDKLSLNNLIQDNTLMKDFLCYQLMGAFGVAAPLCSYVSITVNGELWGLYLAVEGVEDAFLRRNYGTDAGELYKPDSLSSGGDRGGSFDPQGVNGVQRKPEESDGDFQARVLDDIQRSYDLIAEKLEVSPTFFAYPFGLTEPDADGLIRELFPVTAVTLPKTADLSEGLWDLPRHTVTMNKSLDSILNPPLKTVVKAKIKEFLGM